MVCLFNATRHLREPFDIHQACWRHHLCFHEGQEVRPSGQHLRATMVLSQQCQGFVYRCRTNILEWSHTDSPSSGCDCTASRAANAVSSR